MGILNVTPDSFSDGSCYVDPVQAVEHARQLVADGADIIDIGGESTRPGALPVSVAEELRRVIPVIERLAATVSVPLSIDTTKAEVAQHAIAAGAEIINDISGLTFDPAMIGVAAATGAGVVLMHTRGRPDAMQANTEYRDLVADVHSFFVDRTQAACAAGIAPEALVIDPGIGFGKNDSGNIRLIQELHSFRDLGYPLLLGTSRKGFIGRVLNREVHARLYGTAATMAFALMQGVHVFRVHDVHPMRDLLDMTAVLMGSCGGPEFL
jgi:dihydropteroate synthase